MCNTYRKTYRRHFSNNTKTMIEMCNTYRKTYRRHFSNNAKTMIDDV